MYPFERFGDDAKKVLVMAQEEVERARQSYIGTEHLLLGLLRADGSEAQLALARLGVDLEGVRRALSAVVGPEPRHLERGAIPTSRVKKVIELAFETARGEGSPRVGTRHMLLALLEEGEGIAAHVLKDMGVTRESVLGHRGHAPAWARKGGRVLVHDAEPPYRLWEGVVGGRRGDLLTVQVAGHPGGTALRRTLSEVHGVPIADTHSCPLCQYRER